MKILPKYILALWIALPLLSMASAGDFLCSLPPAQSQVYYVMIENAPDEIYGKIIYKSFEIGEITEKELTPNGTYVQIRVRIYEKYIPLIHTNATFYFDEAILRYYAFKETGEPLAEESRILGFDDEIDLNFAIAKMKMEEWYKDFKEWSKEKLEEMR